MSQEIDRSTSASTGWSVSVPTLQFFVRMMPAGKSLVVHAHERDTVKSLHKTIKSLTGIPVSEQRLIYRGKQLQMEDSLAECKIQNDAVLELVGRMLSTGHPRAWRVIGAMVSTIFRLHRGESFPSALKEMKAMMTDYFAWAPSKDSDLAVSYLEVFQRSTAPAALVMLYASPAAANVQCAEDLIELFLSLIGAWSPKKPFYSQQCVFIILEFCELLRPFGSGDLLYISCRRALASLLEDMSKKGSDKLSQLVNIDETIGVKGYFPFFIETADRLSRDLSSSLDCIRTAGALVRDVREFSAFWVRLSFGLGEEEQAYAEEILSVKRVFEDLLIKMDHNLGEMEGFVSRKDEAEKTGDDDSARNTRWSRYLAVLRELHNMSTLYGGEEKLWRMLSERKSSLCYLVKRYAHRADSYIGWIPAHKKALDSESRRLLAMMVFVEGQHVHIQSKPFCMRVDRSRLLEHSFLYMIKARPVDLLRGLDIQFKNEDVKGPEAAQEWFALASQAMFITNGQLFVSCPSDPTRVYPNPEFKDVGELTMDYYKAAGRMVALALINDMRLGITFDRSFFKQLAGARSLSLGDIHAADPELYSHCNTVLQNDPESIFSGCWGSLFEPRREEPEPSKEAYVKLRIDDKFVKSVAEPVSRFKEGFSDLLCHPKLENFFFECLELGDLDAMLRGTQALGATSGLVLH